MFNYLGSKSKIVKHYPAPKYDQIIEPFAGSAQYSLLHGLDRDVWINDKYKVVYEIWQWLIQAKWSDFVNLPLLTLKRGDRISSLKQLSQVERNLLGFICSAQTPYPKDIVTWFGTKQLLQFRNKAKRFARRLTHWKVTCLGFAEIKTELPSAWYIDPPYQYRKSDYMVNNNNCRKLCPRGYVPPFYKQLNSYCRSLFGQVIICESNGADWMQFEPFVTFKGAKNYQRQRELIAYWETNGHSR